MHRKISLASILWLVLFSNSMFGQNTKSIYFEPKLIKEEADMDERYGKNDEYVLLIKDNQHTIETISEYGILELGENKTLLYFTSNMSEKTYEIIALQPNEFILSFSFFCMDCPQQERSYEKKYQLNKEGVWKMVGCQGDCDQ